MGRKYSDKKIIESLVSMNGMVYLAAKVLGCTPQTIYNRMKDNPEMHLVMENSRGEIVDIAEQKFRAAILREEPWAVALALKTLGKTRGYVERQEVTGADGTHIVVKLVND